MFIKKLFCTIFGHKWGEGVERTFVGVGEHLDNGNECIGAINKRTVFTCKRCGNEKIGGR